MSSSATRMLWMDPLARDLGEVHVHDLPALLRPGDLLVVNDAATLPASMQARTLRGQPVEIRLLDAPYRRTTRAVLFGKGDHRQPTEVRPAPARLREGDTLWMGSSPVVVSRVSALSSRLVELTWPGSRDQRFELLYRVGRPVQYSYVPEPLALWDVQTAFATRPWAVEMPSAARPLSASIMRDLAGRGIGVAQLTHAAGLSSTGDPELDAQLPLPERYDIPRATATRVSETRARGGRVLAVGTTVVRALEDSARQHGAATAGVAVATLVLTAETPLRVVSGVLSGVHVPGESHHRLLEAFVDPRTLARGVELAHARDYRLHEFGDAMLVLPGVGADARCTQSPSMSARASAA